MLQRILAEDAILADNLWVAHVDAGAHGGARLLALAVELAGGMRREVLTVLGQLAAGVGHMSVRMIVVVGR